MNPSPKKLTDVAKVPQTVEQPINLAQKVIPTSTSQPLGMHTPHLQEPPKSSAFTTLRMQTPARGVGSTSIISASVPTSQMLSATKPGLTTGPRHVVTTTVYPVMPLGGNGNPVPMASIIRGTIPQTISAHTAGPTLYSSHIPRGPAAVASISAGPKSAVATPILRPTHPTTSTLQQMTVRAPTLGVNRTVTPPQKAAPLTVGHVIDLPKGSVGPNRTLEPATLRSSKPVHISQPLVQHVQQISAEKGYFKTATVISPATVLQPRTCASTCVVTIAPAPSTCGLRTTVAPTTIKTSSSVVSSIKTVADLTSAKKGSGVVVANSVSTTSIPVAKVQPQPSSTGVSPRPIFEAEGVRAGNIYIAHSSPAVVLSSSTESRSESGPVRFASLSRPYAVSPAAAYFYESYPVQNAIPLHSYSAGTPTPSLRPAPHSGTTSVQSMPPTHPVMVTVDTAPVHGTAFTTAGSGDTTSTVPHYTASGTGGYVGLSTSHSGHNTSPRPSILRKRATDGAAVVKKNLLSSLPGSGPTSPRPELSSPKPPSSETPKENGCLDSAANDASRSQTDSSCTTLPTVKVEPLDVPEPASNGLAASPRKKPRKQQLAATELLESHSTDGEEPYDNIKKEIPKEVEEEKQGKCVTFCKRPSMSLINSYRHTWKSRHNHFLRYSDVKPKDDKKCTVNELANQKGVIQKTNGWKIYHLTTQLDDVADLESAVHSRLSGLLEFVEESPPWKIPLPSDEERVLVKVSDLIKGNLQRSKIAQDQVSEMKQQVMRMLDHKPNVVRIIGKYVSKRPIKKRTNN